MRSVDVLVPKVPDQWPSACPQTSFAVPTWARQRGTWAVTFMVEHRAQTEFGFKTAEDGFQIGQQGIGMPQPGRVQVVSLLRRQ